jgi:intergrase/recombinase
MLRDWFCEEMGNLGVADRYVDAFQGRTPKSVLARHYSDYNPNKLKPIYDKADLEVLS